MRRLIVCAIASVLLASCAASADDSDVEQPPDVGDPTLFCAIWPEARRALLGYFEGDFGEHDPDGAKIREGTVARYDRVVPAEIRSDWDRAYDLYNDVADLRFTTMYDEGNVRAEHLVMLFGDAGLEPVLADAMAGIAAIDDWAITACGDFCSRWGELEIAIRFQAGSWHWLADQHERMEHLLRIGSRLVPPGIAGHWAEAARLEMGFIELLREREFDMGFGDPEEEEASFLEHVGYTRDVAEERSNLAIEQLLEWTETNCPDVVTSAVGSGPGRLNVALQPQPGLEAATTLLALLPAGTDFATVGSITDYVGGNCVGGIRYDGPLGDRYLEARERLLTGEDPVAVAADMEMELEEFISSWDFQRADANWHEVAAELREGHRYTAVAETFGFDPLAPFELAEEWVFGIHPIRADTEYDDDVCQVQHEEEVLLEPGAYELFVGAYLGDPGDWRFYVAAPLACAQLPVVIAGDTAITAPVLGPCDLEATGDTVEIARRKAPVDVGDSSLLVRIAEPVTDFGPWCEVSMALLPAGTTLNDVGRGNAWPAGGTRLGMPARRDIDEWMTIQPGLVPILPYPPSQGLANLDPNFREDGTWDHAFPAAVALDAGAYDLRIEQLCLRHQHTDEDAERSCAMVTVDIKGETVVDLPTLGACP